MSSKSSKREELVMALANANRIASTYTVLFHHGIAERLGLNPSDHKCLDMVLLHGPLTAGELAELTGLTTGAITGVIDRLEARGYARRVKDPNDRRRVIVTKVVDENHERNAAKLFTPLIEGLGRLTASYTDKQLEFILEFIGRSSELMREALTQLPDIRSFAGEGKPAKKSGARSEVKRTGTKGTPGKRQS